MLHAWRMMRIRILLALLGLVPARLSNRLCLYLSDRYRMRTSPIANEMRIAILRRQGARIGRCVKILPGVFIEYPQKLKIGDGVSIQHYCYLNAYGGIEIGNDVSIAHGSSVMSSTHSFEGVAKIREATLQAAPVRIGSNVWIGMKSSILMGVRIGDGVVIGACSLVNKDVPGESVAFGIPAKRIRNRRTAL